MACWSNMNDRMGSGHLSRQGRWRPVDIGLMVGGFALYWPLGLAVLTLKLWQRASGADGNVVDFARGQWLNATGWATTWRDAAPFKTRATHGTGNSAFDDWRRSELDRLEAERRKLVDAEREFAAFMDSLRRARDRTEFDDFMRARTNPTQPNT